MRERHKYPIKEDVVEILYPECWEVGDRKAGPLKKLRRKALNDPKKLKQDFLDYTKMPLERGMKVPTIEGFCLHYGVDRRYFIPSYTHGNKQFSEYNLRKYKEWFETIKWIRLWIVDNYLYLDSLKDSPYDFKNQLRRMEEFNSYKDVEELKLRREKQEQDLAIQKDKAKLELEKMELQNEAMRKLLDKDEDFSIIIENK